jgi:hypothetical protein
VRRKVPDDMEWCRKCGEVKPRDGFHKNVNRRSGLQAYCKACQGAYNNPRRIALHRRNGILPLQVLPIDVRLAEHAEAGTTGCLLWTGCRLPNGYGVMSIHSHYQYVHRLAFELARGPIPEGYVIDHLCGTRNCINAAHMEPITPQEHNRRTHRNWWYGTTGVPEYVAIRSDNGPAGPAFYEKRRQERKAAIPSASVEARVAMANYAFLLMTERLLGG